MKKTVIMLGLLSVSIAYAQKQPQTSNDGVGINTESPKVTLDVTGKPTVATVPDGIIAPRITGVELAAKDAVYNNDQKGAIVYVTDVANMQPRTGKVVNVDASGYYYFDGTQWVKFGSGGVAPAPVNTIYTANGALTSAREVTLTDQNTLTFKGGNTSFVKDSEAISLKTQRNDQSIYIGFHRTAIPAGSLRSGFVGFGTPSNSDFSIKNEAGNKILLQPSNTGNNGTVEVSGKLQVDNLGNGDATTEHVLVSDGIGTVKKLSPDIFQKKLTKGDQIEIDAQNTISAKNIYNSNGKLNENREVDVATHSLTFKSTAGTGADTNSKVVFQTPQATIFQKNGETISIKPKDNNVASYIGFYKNPSANDKEAIVGFTHSNAGSNNDDFDITNKRQNGNIVITPGNSGETNIASKLTVTGDANINQHLKIETVDHIIQATPRDTGGYKILIRGENERVVRRMEMYTGGNGISIDADNRISLTNPLAGGPTLYSGNGNLNSSRTVTMGAHTLTFTGNNTSFVRNSEAVSLKSNTANQSIFMSFYKNNPNGGLKDAFIGFGTPSNDDFQIVNATASGKIILLPQQNDPHKANFPGTTEVQSQLIIKNLPSGNKTEDILVAGTDGLVKKMKAYTQGNGITINDRNEISLANPAGNTTLYSGNGTLTSPREVTMNGNTLTFKGNTTILQRDSEALKLVSMANNRSIFMSFYKKGNPNGVKDALIGFGTNGNNDFSIENETIDGKIILRPQKNAGGGFPGTTELQSNLKISTVDYATVNGGAHDFKLIVRGEADQIVKRLDLGNQLEINNNSLQAKNIYNSDGTLTSTRTVTYGPGKYLFLNGNTVFVNDDEAISVKSTGRSNNKVSIGFHKEGNAQRRSGVIGYLESGNNHFTIKNEKSGGNIIIEPTGNGITEIKSKLKINRPDTVADTSTGSRGILVRENDGTVKTMNTYQAGNGINISNTNVISLNTNVIPTNNIYTGNGTLTGDRDVNTANFTLKFRGQHPTRFVKSEETLSVISAGNRQKTYIGFHPDGEGGGGADGYIGYKNNANQLAIINESGTDGILLQPHISTGGTVDLQGKLKIQTLDGGSTADNVLVAGADGLVKKISANSFATRLTPGAQIEIDTRNNNTIKAKTIYNENGRLSNNREVDVFRNSLTFKSTANTGNTNSKVIFQTPQATIFQKDGEIISIKPKTNNRSNFIGFYRTTSAQQREGAIGFGDSRTDHFYIHNYKTNGKIILIPHAGSFYIDTSNPRRSRYPGTAEIYGKLAIKNIPDNATGNKLLVTDDDGNITKITPGRGISIQGNTISLTNTAATTTGNIYTQSGDLTENREVRLNNHSLTFSGTGAGNDVNFTNNQVSFNTTNPTIFQKSEQALVLKNKRLNDAIYMSFFRDPNTRITGSSADIGFKNTTTDFNIKNNIGNKIVLEVNNNNTGSVDVGSHLKIGVVDDISTSPAKQSSSPGLKLLVRDDTEQTVRKMSISEIPTLYTKDGDLSGNRIVTMNSHLLNFKGGKIGIDTDNPAAKLHITTSNGTQGFRYVDGNQLQDRVLTSDAHGNAKWAPASLSIKAEQNQGTQNFELSSDWSSDQLQYVYYTGKSLSIPPGKWLVNITLGVEVTALPQEIYIPSADGRSREKIDKNDGYIFLRLRFLESDRDGRTSNSIDSGTFHPHAYASRYASIGIPYNQKKAILVGTLGIDNTTSSPMTVYIHADMEASSPNYTKEQYDFNSFGTKHIGIVRNTKVKLNYNWNETSIIMFPVSTN